MDFRQKGNSVDKQHRTISVKLDGNKTADLVVEEFQPYEPSAYCYSPGWVCYDLNNDTEYFVDETGAVWLMPENREVGVAPEIQEQCEKNEKALDEAYAQGGM